jgi:FkbM family methyltransferase
LLNSQLKKRVPWLHRFLKWSLARTRLPVPKMLLGRPVWAHSQFLNATVTEEHVLRWIADTLRPGDVFFDVGAHQGWMSMVAARQTRNTGRVIAFEPSPPLAALLSYHKRINRLSQIEVIEKAVSYSDATGIAFNLVGNGNAFMNSLLGTHVEDSSGRSVSAIEVETITLDTFSRLSGLTPRLIKIDTEGSELWVCQGAKELLALTHPVLIIATHPLWLPEGQRIEDLFELLKDLGYRIAASNISRYKGADFGDYLYIAD